MNNKTTIVNSMDNVPIKQKTNVNNKLDVSKYKEYQSNEQQIYTSDSTELDSPLLFASKEIFKETYNLKSLHNIQDAHGISDLMSKELDKFSNIAMELGVSAQHIRVAQYILCTFIDETLSSNWEKDNEWAAVSLLNRYFKEGYGGDKFFTLLLSFEEQPTDYIYLMELAYVCLSFGYGGRYKKKINSLQDLEAIKENLYRQIKITKPKKEKFYANHPAAQRHHKLYSKLSRKIILFISLLLMLVIYGIFTYTVQNNETALISILKDEHNKMKEIHVNAK